ncbi:MAG: hypothetical protein BMS9Abin10_1054 [Gammaproteobacteria bacterium]|nr:MAG: hypothetical protein BMS9Abin10_1054 [Gammaproteobacteria bacterium]
MAHYAKALCLTFTRFLILLALMAPATLTAETPKRGGILTHAATAQPGALTATIGNCKGEFSRCQMRHH